MKVIVVGGGKIGFYLAQTLLEHGHEPVLIEKDAQTCHRIANSLDLPVILGDGTVLDTLESAGIRECDALIGVSGQDECNLVSCQLAKRYFGVGRTVAKVNNPKNLSVMKQLGVDIPISSTDNIARLLEHEVDTAAIKQLMNLNRGEASLSELELPKNFKFHGKMLSQLNLPVESIVVSIFRDGSLIIPRGNTQLLSGDRMVVLCKSQTMHELCRQLELR